MSDWRKIVWLASYPKSGNTWLRCFLDAYFTGGVDINDLICSVSDDNGNRCALGGEGHLDIMKEPVEIVMMTRHMALLRLVDAWRQGAIPHVPLFVKTHNANLTANGVELLPELLTKATIYIVRDPRKVLPSFANHIGKGMDEALKSMCDVYRVLDGRKARKIPDLLSSWAKHVGSFEKAKTHNVLIVRYEDLQDAPVKTFSAILEHAGVTPDVARVEQAAAVVELSKMKKQEEKDGFGEQSHKAETHFFGGARKKPTMKHTRRLELHYRYVMRRHGYLPQKKGAPRWPSERMSS